MYAHWLYEIISLQNISMSKKRTFTYTHPVCWFFVINCRYETDNKPEVQFCNGLF
jgi:hypothetical protein